MRALLGALVAALVTAPAVSQQTQLLPCIDAAARTASFDTRLDDAIACNSENPSQVKAHWEENRCTSWCVLHSDKTSTCNTKSGRKSCVRPVPSNANDDDYTIDDYNYYLINFIRAHIPSYVFDDLSTRLKLINPDSKLTQTQSERKVLFLGIDTVMSLNDPLGAATRTIWSQPQVSFNEAACQALPRLHPDLLCLKLDDEEYQILSLRAARKSLETKELSPDTTAQIINSYVRIFDELFSDLHLDFQRPEPSSSADPIQFTPNPSSSPTSSSSSSTTEPLTITEPSTTTKDNVVGPRIVGEGEECNPNLSQQYATVCEDGLECVTSESAQVGGGGFCTKTVATTLTTSTSTSSSTTTSAEELDGSGI